MSAPVRPRALVQAPRLHDEVVIVLPGSWAGPPMPAISPRLTWRERLARRCRQRWPAIRRSLPRHAVFLLLLFLASRFVGFGWILTDSVHRSAILWLKGAPVRPGELAVFAYPGSPIPGYYQDTAWSRLRSLLGVSAPAEGPRKGEGFVKYLIGVPGDRIEVIDHHVWLTTAKGRIDAGYCKPHSRHGVPLTPIEPQVIPPGQVYMWAPHPDALDSRYAAMGLVPISAIAGRGVPLW